MLAAYFVIPANHKWSIIVDGLTACIAKRVVGAVLVVYFRRLCVKFSQLLTNKKQGNLDCVHACNISKPTQARINCEKYIFCVVKFNYLKILKLAASPI
jgi:hypothetical protein